MKYLFLKGKYYTLVKDLDNSPFTCYNCPFNGPRHCTITDGEVFDEDMRLVPEVTLLGCGVPCGTRYGEVDSLRLDILRAKNNYEE